VKSSGANRSISLIRRPSARHKPQLQDMKRRGQFSASAMTYIVSGGALNSTHSLAGASVSHDVPPV